MSRRLAYAQLLRIPNVFTALTDVSIGLAAGAPLTAWPWLALASTSLYCSGMVGNDYFDRQLDARERPERPIPSGRISARTAQRLMMALVFLGLIAAAVAGWARDACKLQPLAIAALLSGLILAYNARLKNTIFGPLAMGGCRSFNVLLGFSTTEVEIASWPTRLILSAIVGAYIAGVTLFARDEAGQSRASRLVAAVIVIFAALVVAVAVPALGTASGRSLAVPVVALLAAQLGIVVLPALRKTSPQLVQVVVKTAILGLIVLDAALATSLAGPVGLLLLVLAVPAYVVGRWVYST